MSSPFEQHLLPHLDAAYNLARWLLRDAHEAEDAVQEACLRAFRAMDRFRGGEGRPWLLTIVRNECYSRLRRMRREPGGEVFEDGLHGSENAEQEIWRQGWREMRAEWVRQALERLPAELREAIVLHEIEELSYREIAAIAAVPIGTVMSRLSRARHRLHAELTQLDREESARGDR
ncbi:MAG TPA: sigma-70 family RNA polymerase sigma factor [Opitutaceae bacterium]|nr:sigma-70 family RNA polymerase sigma factor [Opitutaceae bacterium]